MQDTLRIDWTGNFDTYQEVPNVEKVTSLTEGEYATLMRSNIPFFEGNRNSPIRFDLPCTTNLVDITFDYQCSGVGKCILNLGQKITDSEDSNRRPIWNATAIEGDIITRSVTLQNIEINPPFDFFQWIELVASPIWKANGSFGISEFTVDNLSILEKEFISSVRTQSESQVHIYPNPTSSELFIDTDFTFDEVLIYNNLGLRIRSFNSENRINISQLESGIYFIMLRNKEDRVVRKVVKE